MVLKGEWSLIILRGNTNEDVPERKTKEVVVKEEWFLVRDSFSLKYERRGFVKNIYKNRVGWESGSGQGLIYEGRGYIKEKLLLFLKGVDREGVVCLKDGWSFVTMFGF